MPLDYWAYLETTRKQKRFDAFILDQGYIPEDLDPEKVSLRTRLTDKIWMPLPFLSAAMRSVTDSKMAIALALEGGLGVLPRSLPIEKQVDELKLVKRYKAGFVYNLFVVKPSDEIGSIGWRYSLYPVTEDGKSNGKLIGIITDKMFNPLKERSLKVKDRMLSIENVISAGEGISLEEANDRLINSKIGMLPIVDKDSYLKCGVFHSDLKKVMEHPSMFVSEDKRLMCGGAVSIWKDFERANALINSGVDAIVIDCAHGYSERMEKTIPELKGLIKKSGREIPIIAGNIINEEGFHRLAKAGADCVKVGQGSGEACETHDAVATGSEQATALIKCVYERNRFKKDTGKYIPICSDGGCHNHRDIIIALVLGADTIMMGGYFAGLEESAAEKMYIRLSELYSKSSLPEEISDLPYLVSKYYGEASVEALEKGGDSCRYVEKRKNFVIEGKLVHKPVLGSLRDRFYRKNNGDIPKIKKAICEQGCLTIEEFHTKAKINLRV